MKYSAAIIGCGRVAWMLEDDPLETKPCTHMGAYQRVLKDTGRAGVVAASDTDAVRLASFGHRFDVWALYPDYRKMLRDVRPDIVSICAWAPDRFRMVMDSIDSGVRGIWCEKAFATSLEEGRAMIEAADGNGTSLIVSHMRRWSPEYARAKEIIESGGIGTLQSIVAHFSGSLIHTGTHAFDILRWFGGPVEWVEGRLERAPGDLPWDSVEDLGGNAHIQFKNGVKAAVLADSKSYFFFEFDIIGSTGRIRIGNNDLLEYYAQGPSRHYTGIRELQARPFPYYDRHNIWTGALSNLLDCVEKKAANRSGPCDGLAALEIALSIHESSRKDGARVHIPLTSGIKVRSR
ncbi:MAG: Gfo/Idh/MocA family oxidoreductase [Deltaproteobacteria bacterium]|nr:Gfo/Idh/MocA family oxidoreductase [Deltaproteobacteria bacterium]